MVSCINGVFAGSTSLDKSDLTQSSSNLSWLYEPAMSPLVPIFASTPEHCTSSNDEDIGSMSPCAPDYSFCGAECDDSVSTHILLTVPQTAPASLSLSSPELVLQTTQQSVSVLQSAQSSVSQPTQSQSASAPFSQLTPLLTMSGPTMSDHSHQLPDKRSSWSGFKLVGDNIDKTVKPRDMRLSHQSSSLHYFHVYAVKDRVDFFFFFCNVDLIDRTTIDTTLFLPSAEDTSVLFANFKELIGRVLSRDILHDEDLFSLTKGHIEHKYSEQMSKKSEVVSSKAVLMHLHFISLCSRCH